MLQTQAVRSAFEIELDGVRFLTIGGVLRSQNSQWAPKVTQGDTDRDSDPLRSTLGFSDLRGGIGLDLIEGAGDSDRMWWSTHDLRYRGHMIHPPLAVGSASAVDSTQRTIPIPTITGATTAAISFIETFQNELYVGFGTKVLKWNETSTTWSTVQHTLPATATSALVARLGTSQQLYLLVACGDSGYAHFDGTTWTNVTTQKVRWFVWWDYELWAMDDAGQLAKAADPTATWADDAWLPVPTGFVSALFTSETSSNAEAIFAVSRDGSLWRHDATNMKFLRTNLYLAVHPDTGVGTMAWRESIYIPSGLALYKFDITAAFSPIQVIGPDRDAGLPEDRAGRIMHLVPTPTSLIAFVQGTAMSSPAARLSPGAFGGLPALRHTTTRRASTILERVGRGWQVLWIGGQDGLSDPTTPVLNNGNLSDAYGHFRLWFGTGTQLWYIDLPRHVINPNQIPDRAYVHYAESITPWFNANIAEVQKVALNILMETRNLYPFGPTVTVDVAFDYEEGEESWQSVRDEDGRPIIFDDSTLHNPAWMPDRAGLGRHSRTGVAFRAIRWRIRSTLGINRFVTSDVTSMTLEYYKRLGLIQKYQFRVTVDLAAPHGGLSVGQLEDKLTDIAAKAELVPLVYREKGRQERIYYVRVLQDARFSVSGSESANAQSNLLLTEI